MAGGAILMATIIRTLVLVHTERPTSTIGRPSAPLSSSGGSTPNLSLTGVVPIANGGTGSATKNFVDLTSAQTIGGAKTFSSNVGIGVTNPGAHLEIADDNSVEIRVTSFGGASE